MSILPLLLLLVIIILIFVVVFQRLKFQKAREDSKRTLGSAQRIYQILLENPDFENIVQKIADTIPGELKFGTGVLAILDDKKGVLRRIAASQTLQAEQAIQLIESMGIPFRGIEISINDQNNLMARSLREMKPFITTNIYDVLGPVLTKEQSKKVQEVMSTNTTFVYPILMQNKPLGVFIASTKKRKDDISEYEIEVLNNFVNLVGLSLQNSKLFTSLKLATTQLQKANLKLQELDKLKDDFVSVASHELRTPMTAIRSYAWMALNRPDVVLTDKMKKYLERTLISTERLINLVNDMLNVSRIEAGSIEIRPKSFDIRALAQDLMVEIGPKAAEKDLHLEVEQGEPLNIFADPDKVHQVLLNLLGNALKFTPSEGKINLSFFPDGKMVEISVKDNGVGISQDDQSRLFRKFERLDNSYISSATSGGTGLGLYISKSLVELMGGKIWATSEGLGLGATFTFSLPLATKEVLDQAEKYSKKPEGELKILEPVAI